MGDEEELIMNDSGWETVSENTDKGVIRQRRTYTIPAPTTAQSSTMINSKKNDAKRIKKAMTMQQKVIRQRQVQIEEEQEEQDALNSMTNNALSELFMKYFKTLFILIFIGGILLYSYAPNLVMKWIKAIWPKPRVTSRSLMTIFPRDVQVRQSLPLFSGAYAIKTPENEPARNAVVHVAELRSKVVEPPVDARQTIRLHAWEHDEFIRQMKPEDDTMERFCGPGFRDMYMYPQSNNSYIQKKKQDDLMIWCFLANGHHDGFVKYEIHDIRNRIARGTKGVAIVRFPPEQHRIHSDSLLILPLHQRSEVEGDLWIWHQLFGSDKKGKRSKKLKPTTMAAFAALEWLNVNAKLDDPSFVKLFEELLYEWIVTREHEKYAEKSNWELWNAACTHQDRLLLMPTQQLIGSTCPEEVIHLYDRIKQNNHDNDDEDQKIKDLDEEEEEKQIKLLKERDCCTFHDPKLEASYRYREKKDKKRRNADDGD